MINVAADLQKIYYKGRGCKTSFGSIDLGNKLTVRNACAMFVAMKIFLVAILILANSIVRANELTNIREAQQFQEQFDETYWFHRDFEKLRHILLHLVKTTGKMATYCEIKEHGKVEPDPSQLVNEVLPDLLIHALQMANYYQVDLSEKYVERIQFIIDRSTNSQNGFKQH